MYHSVYNPTAKPTLIEPGVKYFLNETLQQCHAFKEKHKNTMINVGIFIGLMILLAGFLLYKYKGKLSVEEQRQQDEMKKQYILNKIRDVQIARKKANETLITGLPHWDLDYDVVR
jgi:hypothetical protein